MWTGVHCSPNLHPVHDGNYVLACVSAAYYTSVARGSLSLAADLVIFVMPLPLVAKLKLSRQRKLSVFLVFFTGSFGIAAAVWSLYYKFAHQAVLNSSTIANFQISTYVYLGLVLLMFSILISSQRYRMLRLPRSRLRSCPPSLLDIVLEQNVAGYTAQYQYSEYPQVRRGA